MSKTCVLISLLLTLAVAANAVPPSQRNAGKMVQRDDSLYSTWASTDLSGDAIWMVVSKIFLVLDKGGNFKAVAEMSGGGTKRYDGTFHVDKDKIRFKAKSGEDIFCYYTLENGKLTIKPTSHNVTIILQRGSLPQGSGARGGPPGMHF